VPMIITVPPRQAPHMARSDAGQRRDRIALTQTRDRQLRQSPELLARLTGGGHQRDRLGQPRAVRDDLPSSLPPRDADPAAVDARAFRRTAGAGTPGRRQVTPAVMTTDRTVNLPPSKSRSRQEYAAVRRSTSARRHPRGLPHHLDASWSGRPGASRPRESDRGNSRDLSFVVLTN